MAYPMRVGRILRPVPSLDTSSPLQVCRGLHHELLLHALAELAVDGTGSLCKKQMSWLHVAIAT